MKSRARKKQELVASAYKFKVSLTAINQVLGDPVTWCYKKYGSPGRLWQVRLHDDINIYKFKKADHRDEFARVWRLNNTPI
jgi:hypothetical protein